MISWYLDSSRTDENYLKKVSEIVEPCMEWLENRLCEEDIEPNNVEESIERIINEELPILKFMKSDPNRHNQACIVYNSYTLIRFNDGFKGLVREIRLNKILA